MIFTDKEGATSRPSAIDTRRELVDRVITSSLFSKSERLSSLLTYVCDLALNGRANEINEQKIGEAVFGRPRDYDSAIDGIVRTQASRLRQRLDLYFDGEGANEPIKIVIPRGGYVPFFELRSPTPMAVPASAASPIAQSVISPRETPQVGRRRSGTTAVAWSLVAILSIAILMMSLRNLGAFTKAQSTRVAGHPLWSHFFQPHQITTFVAADSGLVLLHRMTQKETTLTEYLSHDFGREMRGLSPERTEEILNIANRRYTSFVDLNTFRRIQQLPFVASGKLEVKYARDVQMNELKQGNVILSGARGANPWLELYEPELNFVGSNDGAHHTYSFINHNPQAGEPAEFFVSEADPKQRVLGVLAFLPNLDGNGNALIVEGNSMAGTEAISDFLFDDNALLPFLGKLRKPDGTLPHFEVLIEANSVNGSAGPFHILAFRTHL
ncbi:MAG: hypothetical protein JWQ42_630 [Edaphobacter sp.]|nr:hypothetical protein [Edaphobacter sp.]